MSRELFRELLSAEGPSAVSAFQAFIHTSVALGERRAGVEELHRVQVGRPRHRRPSELGVNILRRTISDPSDRSPRTWS